MMVVLLGYVVCMAFDWAVALAIRDGDAAAAEPMARQPAPKNRATNKSGRHRIGGLRVAVAERVMFQSAHFCTPRVLDF